MTSWISLALQSALMTWHTNQVHIIGAVLFVLSLLDVKELPDHFVI